MHKLIKLINATERPSASPFGFARIIAAKRFASARADQYYKNHAGIICSLDHRILKDRGTNALTSMMSNFDAKHVKALKNAFNFQIAVKTRILVVDKRM